MPFSTTQFEARPFRSPLFYLALFLPVLGLAAPCHAQRNYRHSSYGQMNSGAAITLTATLSQSLSMSVSRPAPASAFNLLAQKPDDGSPLIISTNWVRGSGNVSVEAFSPGNPLLGRAGQAIVPVGVASPITASSANSAGESFLSSPSDAASHAGLPVLQIATSDLRIPEGSAGQFLTIRAQAP